MEERRLVPRWQMESAFAYKVLGKETKMSGGLLQDINLVGAKVYLKIPVAVQSKVRLEIKVPNQLIPIFAEGEVIWQNSPKTEGFLTGIHFVLFRPSDKERILDYFERQIRENWWREEPAKS